MKEYTRGMYKLGKGAINSKSVKQKVNINSSTIIELIGTYDMVPEVLWTKYFIKAQDCKVDNIIVMQDSKLDIRLLVNDRFSSRPKTKHMKVKNIFQLLTLSSVKRWR